jgi:hypothetical protein
MEAAIRAVPLSIVFALLGACGGGGGGGGGGVVVPGPTAIEVPFASFAAIAPNQTVIMDGTAVTASGNQTIAGNGEVTITSAADLNPAGAATVRLSYDGSRELKGMSVSTLQPNSSVSFDRDTPGHSISCGGGTCLAQSPTASAVAADAVVLNWNYQSYGVWATDLSPSSWVAGAVSAGRATPGNAVPTSGNAVFNGIASGFYFDSSGMPFATAASMKADVDFSNQRIGFSTSNTTLVSTNSGVPSPDGSGLNLSGNFSYQKGVNAFSGPVNTANSQLTGQGSGRFYGPAAEEIGGVYSLQGTGVSRMIGGFGGKR